ncbi:hypothetical protein U1Q18_050524, partial [Sarracenia purpurea var. burkii]
VGNTVYSIWCSKNGAQCAAYVNCVCVGQTKTHVNHYNHDEEELVEGIMGKLHCLPKNFFGSLELARLEELDELANVS